jgi:hypothetical protein
MPLYDRVLRALRTWLDSWSGVGHVAAGMDRQSYDLQRYGWFLEGVWQPLLAKAGFLIASTTSQVPRDPSHLRDVAPQRRCRPTVGPAAA